MIERAENLNKRQQFIYIYFFFLNYEPYDFVKLKKFRLFLIIAAYISHRINEKKNKFLHRIKLIDLNKLYGVLALDSSLLYALSMLTNNFGTLCIQGETLILYINSD